MTDDWEADHDGIDRRGRRKRLTTAVGLLLVVVFVVPVVLGVVMTIAG